MTSAAELPANVGFVPASEQHSDRDPQLVTNGVYVVVHGHFYQPPRENPYLDTIERQPGAAPFHNWNARIHHECYRPNAYARVLNNRGEVVGIVNNYEYMSFNIGPTLMSWLERHDFQVYQQIIEADRSSCARLNGHGNAIAQVYNHIIMPLANTRDKYTQIRWGKYDFQSRFGRAPQGMWLAEAAVDYPTLTALVDEGIEFIVLAPSQAQRCRPLPTDWDREPQWHEVGGSQIDPTQPYRCYLRDDSDNPRHIDIFFYDGPISRDMGFSDVVYSSSHFAGRIGAAIRAEHESQLISVATDGETFGHHKHGTEKTLAYAFVQEFPQRGWTVSNYAHYLNLHPPTWEVELKPVTAWSCAHGVDRWQDDCGCGGAPGWHLKWRRPLRDSLDWLRDRLIIIYEEYAPKLLCNPWLARDEYIEVIRDRSRESVTNFLQRHQTHPLSESERVDALRLLEMQRHALLMYTSCGWFFEEVSRPEGTQILRYAARALELAADVSGVQLERQFMKHLTKIPSNIDEFINGEKIYQKLVVTSQITIEQVAAHHAITSLFNNHHLHDNGDTRKRVYCYTIDQSDYNLQRMGALTLAVGNIELVSEITWESRNLVFAVLHLGGWDFHCCIQPFDGRRKYGETKAKLFASLQKASAAQVILDMAQIFGESSYSLQDLFAEERQKIMATLTQETLGRLDQLYHQVYRDNYGVIMAFHRDDLPVPQELQVAAEIALGQQCLTKLQALERDISDMEASNNHLLELAAIATEAKHLRSSLNIPAAKILLEQLISRLLWQILHDDRVNSNAEIERLESLIKVANGLNLGISLDYVQEIYVNYLHQQILPQIKETGDTHPHRQLLMLGKTLKVDVSKWVDS